MAENFDLIFGQNASQQYAWNDVDYQNGWETIGNIPPTAEQFDALQRRSDTKMKELNDELTPLVNADTADSRQPSTTYSEGDIKYSPLLPTGWFLTCTTAGITSASEIVLPTPIAEGDTVTDGEVVWEIDKIGAGGSGGGGVPIGAMLPLAHNGAVPDGYLLCDGSAVSRTTYADLFAAIGTTWGSGNGSTTFSLPNLNGYWLKGSSTAGSSISAGLPNITGSITSTYLSLGNNRAETTTHSGALIDGNYTQKSASGTATNAYYMSTISFNASSSNSIYGSSSTVSVSSKTVRFIIKY